MSALQPYVERLFQIWTQDLQVTVEFSPASVKLAFQTDVNI